MQLAHFLGVPHRTETALATGFREVAEAHSDETEGYFVGHQLAQQCQQQADALAPFVQRYGEDPEATRSARLHGPRGPGLGRLRDLADQLAWLRTQLTQSSVQALVVA